MMSFKEYREPKHRLPDYLPWAVQLSETTILQKDGLLLRSWRYRGPDLAAASAQEQAAIAVRANAALARLGSGWSIWIEMARHRSEAYDEGEFEHVAPRIVDLEARSLFAQARVVHESECYLSLGWQSPTDREASIADKFYASDDAAPSDGALQLELDYFERTCNELVDILAGIFVEIEPLRDDELLTYLKSCVSTVRQRVAAPDCPAYLDAYLPDEAFTPGEISLLGDQCLALFTVRGFPKSTPFGMLDELCHVGIEFRWCTRFIALDRDEAERLISRHQQRHFMGRKSLAKYGSELLAGEESRLQNPIAQQKADEAGDALRLLGAGEIAFGFFTSTFVVWDEDPQNARRKALELKKILQRRRLIVVDETLNGLHAWLGTIPGHVHANVRRPLLHTGNLVRMMPLMARYTGQRENKHLKAITGIGIPHVCCISGTSRFDLSLAVGDVGHTIVVGPAGNGKTTLAGYLMLMWLKYGPRAKVIIYDVGAGARAATMAVGGAYYAPGTPDGKCTFQPLRLVQDPAERAWTAQWLRGMLELRQQGCDHNVENAIEQVLGQMAVNADPRSRTLTSFVRLFSSYYPELAAALRIYTLEGDWGRIFDGDSDPLGDGPWRCYEMKPSLGLPRAAVAPLLQYLSHRDEAVVDGSPILKVKDECWRFWDDPAMRADTRSDVKIGRVNHIYNVYLTQDLADVAAQPELVSALLNNCKTHIYLPNAKATLPVIAEQYEAFGLTPSEIQLLTKATPKKHYFYRSELGRSWFSLPVGPAALAFIGGASRDDLRAMDAIERERPPEEYALALLELRARKLHDQDPHSGVQPLAWAIDAAKRFGGGDRRAA